MCLYLTLHDIIAYLFHQYLILVLKFHSRTVANGEGYNYVFFIVDHAMQMCWVFPLKTRESRQTFVNEVLPSLNICLRRFHSRGGVELVAADMTISHSPCDTPPDEFCY